MVHDWVIDVVTDLRRYAEANALPGLARQLRETELVAALDIASRPASMPSVTGHLGQAQSGLHSKD